MIQMSQWRYKTRLAPPWAAAYAYLPQAVPRLRPYPTEIGDLEDSGLDAALQGASSLDLRVLRAHSSPQGSWVIPYGGKLGNEKIALRALLASLSGLARIVAFPDGEIIALLDCKSMQATGLTEQSIDSILEDFGSKRDSALTRTSHRIYCEAAGADDKTQIREALELSSRRWRNLAAIHAFTEYSEKHGYSVRQLLRGLFDQLPRDRAWKSYGAKLGAFVNASLMSGVTLPPRVVADPALLSNWAAVMLCGIGLRSTQKADPTPSSFADQTAPMENCQGMKLERHEGILLECYAHRVQDARHTPITQSNKPISLSFSSTAVYENTRRGGGLLRVIIDLLAELSTRPEFGGLEPPSLHRGLDESGIHNLLPYLLEAPVDWRRPDYLVVDLIRQHNRVLRRRILGEDIALGKGDVLPLHLVPLETFDKVRWPSMATGPIAALLQAREALIQPFADHISHKLTGSSLVSDRTIDVPILREAFRHCFQAQKQGTCTFQADGTVATSQMSPALAHGKLLVLFEAYLDQLNFKSITTTKGLISAMDILTFVPAGMRLEEGCSTSCSLVFAPDEDYRGSKTGSLIERDYCGSKTGSLLETI